MEPREYASSEAVLSLPGIQILSWNPHHKSGPTERVKGTESGVGLPPLKNWWQSTRQSS